MQWIIKFYDYSHNLFTRKYTWHARHCIKNKAKILFFNFGFYNALGIDISQNLTCYKKNLNCEILFLQIEYFYKNQDIFQTIEFLKLILTTQKVLKFTIKNNLICNFFLKFFDLQFCISKGSRWVKHPVELSFNSCSDFFCSFML